MTKKVRGQDWILSALKSYEGRLVRYAMSLTRNIETARDVVQETFLRLCDEDRAKVEGQLKAWLFKVCRNKAIDVLRKESRMTTVDNSELDTRHSPDPSPYDSLAAEEKTKSVITAVDSLPERQRELIRLKFQEGMSYKEISEVTSLSVSNVGFILHQAMTALRGSLNEGEKIERRSQ